MAISAETNEQRLNGISKTNGRTPSSSQPSAVNSAFVLKEKGHFYYEDRPKPSLPSEDYVIVKVCCTGICGSDVHYWTHGEIGDFKVRQPLVLGHESTGIVQECGSAVKTLKPGDRVALEPGTPCRRCEFCRAGRYNLCTTMKFAATPPYDGTLATFYTLPEDFCYLLPEHVTLEEGALIEPLSVAVHCARLADLSFGLSVLVLGAGPIGLLCCAVARAYGASNVTVVDINAGRLAFAKDYAATAVYQMNSVSADENARRIMKMPGLTDGAKVVIDATGAQQCISTGIHVLKHGGIFIQAGLGAAEIAFPVAQLCSKEATYRGSFRYGPGDYQMAIELLQQRKLSVKELITDKFDFDQAEMAFRHVEQRRGIKTVIYGPNNTLGAYHGSTHAETQNFQIRSPE
ncbi:hypothetical protein LTR84_009467 [Exophiala bonariae]|uniref:Enoyl reductase (ER) domain-containing protein n=1 Tax=Exophiala bonariae TaxID=1690606 RepID=A0AAV9MUM4_9EURO|nr:hypothetical protein LTR84_009467 [Exophiala bonariae]